jgi:hypothetical protein
MKKNATKIKEQRIPGILFISIQPADGGDAPTADADEETLTFCFGDDKRVLAAERARGDEFYLCLRRGALSPCRATQPAEQKGSADQNAENNDQRDKRRNDRTFQIPSPAQRDL